MKPLAIEDVYIRETHARVRPDFDPLAASLDPAEAVGVQFRCAFEPNPKCDPHRVLFAVNTGVRVLKPGVSVAMQSPAEGEVVAEIDATFIVRYLSESGSPPSRKVLEAFQDDVVQHLWPYWREYVQGAAARLRLPPILLPVRPATGSK